MSSSFLDSPNIQTLSGCYVLGGMRATSGSGNTNQYPLGNQTHGWSPVAPIKVRSLCFSYFLSAMGGTGAAVNVQLYNGSISGANLIFIVQWLPPTAPGNWYYARDVSVNNAGKEYIDPGEKLIGRVVSKPGTGTTNLRDFTFSVDYEYLA